MSVPLIIVSQFGSQAASAEIGAVLAVHNYITNIQAWNARPERWPTPQEAFRAWQCGWLPAQTLWGAMRFAGIDTVEAGPGTVPPPGSNARQLIWQAILNTAAEQPDREFLVRNAFIDRTPFAVLRHGLRRHGVTSPVTQNSIIYPRKIPDVALVTRNWWRQKIDDDKYEDYLKAMGFTGPKEISMFTEDTNYIDATVIINAINREAVSPADGEKLLEQQGFRDIDQRQLLLLQRYIMPTGRDVLPLAYRRVWDPEIVARYQYDAEFPPELQRWADRTGTGWKPGDLYPGDPAGSNITWPQAFWRAHWELISPQQVMSALHRLREDVPGSGQSRYLGIPPFTEEDFNLHMRVANYPPLVRGWLKGLSYTPISIRSLRQLYNTYVINRDQVYNFLRDNAYAPSDAENITRNIENTRWEQETAKVRKKIAEHGRHLYVNGFFDENNALLAIYPEYLKTQAGLAQWNAMTPDARRDAARNDPAVSAEITALDMEITARQADAVIAAVKASAMRREIDMGTAVSMLSAAGIKGDRIQQYVTLWNLELMAKGKTAGASQILRWVIRGALSPQEAAQRLRLMGYGPRDISIMLSVAGEDAGHLAARTAEKVAKSARDIQKLQEKQLKDAAANRARIIKQLNTNATRSGILKWLKDGLINEQEAFTALTLRGIQSIDARLWIKDTLLKKDKSSGKSPSSTPGPAGAPDQGHGGNGTGDKGLPPKM